MIILLPLNDLLDELFPAYKESGHDLNILKEELYKYYSYSGEKPNITISDDVVKIEIDIPSITAQKQEYNKVVSLCEQVQFDKAKPILEKLIEKNPSNSEYHRIKGQILSDQGDQDAAIDSLIEALRWDPQNGYALVMMGNIFAKFKDDIQTARVYYDQAIESNPNDSIAVNNFAATLMEKGNIEKAKEYLLRAEKINPEYPNTQFALGMIYEIENKLFDAFGYTLNAINLNDKKDALYKSSMQQLFQVAQSYVKDVDVSEQVNDFKSKLEKESGFKIEITKDPQLHTAAKIEYAENYNRDKHIIKFKPGYPAVEPLIIHELIHYEFALEAKKHGENMLFVSTQQHKEKFIASHKPTIDRLKKIGVDKNGVNRFFNELFDGINLQAYNTPIDLFIEQKIYDEFPKIRPYHLLSLYQLQKEAIKAVTDKTIIEIAPPKILSNSKIYNLINAMQFKDLYGADLLKEFNATKAEMTEAKSLYDEYKQYKDDRKPGEEYELVDNWASDLGLGMNFDLIEETQFRKKHSDTDSILSAIEEDPMGLKSTDPEEEEQMKTFQDREAEIGTNMAVVMYMIDALNYFDTMSKGEIRKIAFEIGMLGRQGFNPQKKGYTTSSIPNKTFSGYHILAYYYVSWKLAIPEMVDQLQLPYDEEYKMALSMRDQNKEQGK